MSVRRPTRPTRRQPSFHRPPGPLRWRHTGRPTSLVRLGGSKAECRAIAALDPFVNVQGEDAAEPAGSRLRPTHHGMFDKGLTGNARRATLLELSTTTRNTVSTLVLPQIADHACKNLASSSVDVLPPCGDRCCGTAASVPGDAAPCCATDPGLSVRRHSTAIRRCRDGRPRSAIDPGLGSTGAMARRAGGADTGATRTPPMTA